MHSQVDILSHWKNKRCLVTGAAGFLGYHLCKQLIKAGSRVIGVDGGFEPESQANMFLDWVIYPIRVEDQAFRTLVAATDVDAIFHLAGLAYASQSVANPISDFEANLAATLRVLETLRVCNFQGRLIYASSAAVYGQPDVMPINENANTIPISPYGVSKLAAEYYINVFSNLYGFQNVVARLFSLYGPYQKKQVVYDIMRKFSEDIGQINLLGDGTEIRDFMYVEDAANALLFLGATSLNRHKIFNVCSGKGVSIRDLAEAIAKTLAEPLSHIQFHGERRPGDPLTWIGCQRLLDSTGFQTQFSLEEGLVLTWNWWKTGYLNR